MLLPQTQASILATVAQFRDIAKYHGVMPHKHVIAFDEGDTQALVAQDLLEWTTFTLPCGVDIKGLRLTPEGERFQADPSCELHHDAPRSQDAPPVPDGTPLATLQATHPATQPLLAHEYLVILKDVFHFSAMPRYHFMMPKKKARFYEADDIEDLIDRGYIIQVRVEAGGDRKYKGYTISTKGRQALADAELV